MARIDEGFQELLVVCREMMDYIRKDKTGRPRKSSVLVKAVTALERAELDIEWMKRRQAAHASPYFGKVGKRYDFKLKVTEARRREYGYKIMCIDPQGRTYTFKAGKELLDFDVFPGTSLFLRGKIADRGILHNRHVTYLEVLSDIQQLSSIESL